ncbi:glycosyltransferase family protein [Spiroplasma cantharicola]|uniref:Galanin n=1 Tax=Spiroplasma cantharicola TaxID=362837 RepID=A0A0M4JT71_9MOLU|nr:hypothetical protein [Spiroplasma cantharicola]ALD66872.1 hypothetical protein SCANT_v1c09660 [Spiroplasma cantharicola]
MQELNYLEETIEGFIEKHLDKSKLDSLLNKRKKYFTIGIILCLIAIVGFGLIILLFSNIEFEMGLIVFLILSAIDLIAVILGVKFFSKSKRIRKSVFDYINQIEWQDIYNESFEALVKEIANPFIKKVKFINLERTYINSLFKKYYGSPWSFLANYTFFRANEKRNCLNFSFEDKLVNYQFNQTVRTVEEKKRKTKNGTKTIYVHNFVATTILRVENKKFDTSYNGIVILPGKSKKDNYNTESMQFNEKYNINVSNTDLRGPKFLRPKYIDNLTMKNTKNLSGIAIVTDFIVGHQYVSKNNIWTEICIFDKEASFSTSKIIKGFAKKVISDINNALEALTFLDGIY